MNVGRQSSGCVCESECSESCRIIRSVQNVVVVVAGAAIESLYLFVCLNELYE